MWHSTLLLILFACVCAAQTSTESVRVLRGTVLDSSSSDSDLDSASGSDLDSTSDSDADSSSGSTSDIYNVCPVVVNFSEEQDDLSDEELKANAADAAMSAYLLSHPNNTLWDYFKIERKQKRDMNSKLPWKDRLKNAIKDVVDFTADTLITIAKTIASAVEWILNTIRDPLVGIKQITSFFKEFGKNIKSLWGLMKEDPKETAENMAGGLLLHITHHPAEFTGETVLMISAGFGVIGGLMAGVEAVFGTMSNAISNVLLSVLMFIHAIDDPIYIVTPLVTSIVNTADTIANGNSTTNVTTLTQDAIKPLKACKIPKEYRPVFSSRDLCLSTPSEVRQLLFGSTKRSIKMTKEERVGAYNRFHDFVCCYLQDQSFEVNAPKVDATAFESELVATPVKMTNCSQRLGNYSEATVWTSSVSLEGSTSLVDDSASDEE
ncbi:hypothetical protein KRP22_004032 [Phytophthora ramorum]|uniref:uncharacterized protein n=1 Tax=Phytophthora ramorum TaxID=164328 RepID=UPI003098461F|nr:hypothetical protein KRP23_8408 [Phytophthora ramorum]KAH7500719.1 hypothetical protein KRP22_9965 [Phytophthora ramorum]